MIHSWMFGNKPQGWPIDAYMKLLLHMDGADQSTTFTDSSLSPHTMTAKGAAKLVTANYYFPPSSGLFVTGGADYVESADSTDWIFDAGNGSPFTVDFWMRITDISSISGFFGYGTKGIAGGLGFYHNGATNLIYFVFTNDTGAVNLLRFTAPFSPTQNVWYHLALVRIDSGNSASSWRIA